MHPASVADLPYKSHLIHHSSIRPHKTHGARPSFLPMLFSATIDLHLIFFLCCTFMQFLSPCLSLLQHHLWQYASFLYGWSPSPSLAWAASWSMATTYEYRTKAQQQVDPSAVSAACLGPLIDGRERVRATHTHTTHAAYYCNPTLRTWRANRARPTSKPTKPPEREEQSTSSPPRGAQRPNEHNIRDRLNSISQLNTTHLGCSSVRSVGLSRSAQWSLKQRFSFRRNTSPGHDSHVPSFDLIRSIVEFCARNNCGLHDTI